MFVSKKKYKKLEEEYNKLLDFSILPTIEKMEAMKGNIMVRFGGPKEAIIAWAQIMTQGLVASGATNYLEITLGNGKDQFVCTIKKLFGKTPDRLRREAEEKVKDLEEKVKILEEEIKVLKGN